MMWPPDTSIDVFPLTRFGLEDSVAFDPTHLYRYEHQIWKPSNSGIGHLNLHLKTIFARISITTRLGDG